MGEGDGNGSRGNQRETTYHQLEISKHQEISKSCL